MKKVWILLLAILLIAVIAASAAVPAAAASGYICGDVDGDNEITVLDALLIQRKLVKIPVAVFNEQAADVSSDGLDVNDALWIQRYVAKSSNLPYPIGKWISVPQPTRDEYELPFVPA